MATMAKDTYIPRLIDRKIDQYLNLFGAVEISGTKWCGKTWSALAHANSAIYVDRGSNQLLIESDPQYALVGATPHVIDEWQRVPQVWDCVRHAVDDTTEKGQWILTGSSTPEKDKVNHSGAGRIGRLSMHPMSLQESGDSTGKVSLAALFKGEFAPCPCTSGIDSLTGLICRGGWPDALALTSDTIRPVLMGYLDAVHNKSVPDLGGRELISSRVAESLARNLGQSCTNVTLARDVFALDSNTAPTDAQKREVSQHLEYLVQLYLIDELPGWVPASRSPNRMRTKPKRYFADPSLAVAALGLNNQAYSKITRRSDLYLKTSACEICRYTPRHSMPQDLTPSATTVTIQTLKSMPLLSLRMEHGEHSRSSSARLKSSKAPAACCA